MHLCIAGSNPALSANVTSASKKRSDGPVTGAAVCESQGSLPKNRLVSYLKSVGFNVYVDDPDAVVEKAIRQGAKLLMPVEDQFYGNRTGQILDPFGHKWSIAKYVNRPSWEEMQIAMDEMMESDGSWFQHRLRECARILQSVFMTMDAL